MLSGAALANHECRLQTFDTVGGQAARLVPIGPNAHCGTRGRAALTEREARIEAYFGRRDRHARQPAPLTAAHRPRAARMSAAVMPVL
jgi:hypothetical protein